MSRFAHGLVLGKFYPLHAGHSFLVRRALDQCETVTVQVLGASVESIPLEVRVDWMRQEHPSARIVAAIDDAVIDFDSPSAWDEHMTVIESLLDRPVDAVFTSDGYGVELARRLRATWVQVDPDRTLNPVSGRAVRADVPGHWHLLPASVREWLVRRVVVLGAESTGSTTLARDLADHYLTRWVPEYGREYSEIRAGGLEADWRDDEFELVIERQFALESEAARRAPMPLLVCDTDVLATALWFERYMGRVDQHIHDRAAAHPPLLYLLTGDEIPFVQDGMRDGEHIRHAMQDRFRAVLAEQAVPWIEVTGSPTERLAAAIAAIDPLLARAHEFSPSLEDRDPTPDTLSS